MQGTLKRLFLVVSVVYPVVTAKAATLPMTLDSSQSSIKISVLFNGTIPFSLQGPGSDTASYSGPISVKLDNVLAPTSIQILGSSAAASISGQWLPESGGGPAIGNPGVPQDANYGFTLNLGAAGMAWIALRDVVFDASSGVEAVAGGSFASNQTLEVASGVLDFNVPAALGGAGQDDQTGGTLTNNSATMSTYSVVGSTATLKIPINIIDPGSTTVVYTGQLVATAHVPEPASIALLASALGMIAIARKRR